MLLRLYLLFLLDHLNQACRACIARNAEAELRWRLVLSHMIWGCSLSPHTIVFGFPTLPCLQSWPGFGKLPDHNPQILCLRKYHVQYIHNLCAFVAPSVVNDTKSQPSKPSYLRVLRPVQRHIITYHHPIVESSPLRIIHSTVQYPYLSICNFVCNA